MKSERDRLLTKREFRALLAVAKRQSARDYALVCLAGNLGLRIGEVVQLRLGDLHLVSRPKFVRVSTLKRRRTGPTYSDLTLSDRLHRGIAGYLRWLQAAARAYHVTPERAYLFHRPRNLEEPITARAASKRFKRLVRLAGLSPQCSFHALRHYRAMMLLRSGGDIAYVANRLRHASVRSVYPYLHSDPEREAELDTKTEVVL